MNVAHLADRSVHGASHGGPGRRCRCDGGRAGPGNRYRQRPRSRPGRRRCRGRPRSPSRLRPSDAPAPGIRVPSGRLCTRPRARRRESNTVTVKPEGPAPAPDPIANTRPIEVTEAPSAPLLPPTPRAGTRRRVPRRDELRPYLRTGPLRLSPVERRLASAASIRDLRQRSAPRPAGCLRLRRRCRRDGDEPASIARGLCPRRVRAQRPARRVRVDTTTTMLGRPSRCRWSSRRPASPASCTRTARRPSRASRAGWASPMHCPRWGRHRRRTWRPRLPIPTGGSSSTSGMTGRPASTSFVVLAPPASRRSS